MHHTSPSFTICPIGEEALPAALEVYRQCEDFLALGPVAQASEAMVRADLALSRESGGEFHGIFDASSGAMVGVLDFIPATADDAPYIALLMIAAPYRGQGLGRAVLAALTAALRARGPLAAIEASVQVNNPLALRFWEREGFAAISAPELQADGTTAVRMRKTFTAPPE